MSASANHEGEDILKLMTAVTQALKSTAGSGKLKKPEVVAALLKVLRSVVSSTPGESKHDAAGALKSPFAHDIEAIQAFLATNRMA